MKALLLALAWLALPAFALTPEEIGAHLQHTGTITGQFTQERYLRGMTMPIESAGKFSLNPAQKLLWQLEKPFVSELQISKDGITQTYGDNHIPAAGGANVNRQQTKLLLALLTGDMRVLNDYFTVGAQGTPDDWQLLLQPKGAFLQHIFRQITVWGGEFVRQVLLEEAQGDRTIIHFSKQKVIAP